MFDRIRFYLGYFVSQLVRHQRAIVHVGVVILIVMAGCSGASGDCTVRQLIQTWISG